MLYRNEVTQIKKRMKWEAVNLPSVKSYTVIPATSCFPTWCHSHFDITTSWLGWLLRALLRCWSLASFNSDCYSWGLSKQATRLPFFFLFSSCHSIPSLSLNFCVWSSSQCVISCPLAMREKVKKNQLSPYPLHVIILIIHHLTKSDHNTVFMQKETP